MATVQPLTFVPTSISGCSLWLDAADPATVILSSGSVSQWNDKSGNGNTATLNSGAIGYSQNALVFNGTQVLQTNLSSANNTQTIFFVATANASNLIDVLSVSSTGATSGFQYSLTNFQQTIARYGGTPVLTGATLTSNVRFLYNASIVGGASAFLYANGSQTGFSNPAPSLSGSGTVTIGGFLSSGSPGQRFSGTLNEVIVYTTSFTTPQRQQVEGYLAWKWGLQANLPTTHPYYSIAPNSQGLGIPPGLRLAAPTQSFQTSSVGLPFLNPTSLSGIQLWLDGQDPNGTGIVPSNGASISTWVDKSGVGNNGTAGGSTPTYNLSTRGLTFSSGYYNTNYSASLQSETVFLVFISPTLTNFQRMMSSTGGGRELFLNSAGSLFAKSVATGDMVNTGSGTITGATTILMTYQLTSAANPVIYTFGTLRGTGSYVTLSAGRTTAIGYLPGGTDYFAGTMFEVIGYNTSLSTLNRQQVEGYLAWKWNLVASLPSSHPFKTRSPVLVPFPLTRTLGQGAFSPARISGIQVWLDATDPNGNGIVPANNSTLNTWIDKSGNGYNAAAGVNATYSTNGVIMNASSYLNTSYTAVPAAESLFIVGLFNGSVDVRNYALLGPSALNGRSFHIYRDIGNSALAFYWGRWGVLSYGGTYGPTFNTRFLVDGIYNGTTGTIGLNGSTQSPPLAFSFSGTSVTQVGAAINNSIYSGVLNEILIYNTALSVPQRQSIEGYLAWKWGLQGNLPATHPYSKFPPPPN